MLRTDIRQGYKLGSEKFKINGFFSIALRKLSRKKISFEFAPLTLIINKLTDDNKIKIKTNTRLRTLIT